MPEKALHSGSTSYGSTGDSAKTICPEDKDGRKLLAI